VQEGHWSIRLLRVRRTTFPGLAEFTPELSPRGPAEIRTCGSSSGRASGNLHVREFQREDKRKHSRAGAPVGGPAEIFTRGSSSGRTTGDLDLREHQREEQRKSSRAGAPVGGPAEICTCVSTSGRACGNLYVREHQREDKGESPLSLSGFPEDHRESKQAVGSAGGAAAICMAF
jgi:hypothetical protein